MKIYVIPQGSWMYIAVIADAKENRLTSATRQPFSQTSFKSIRQVQFAARDKVNLKASDVYVFRLPENEYGPFLVVAQKDVIIYE